MEKETMDGKLREKRRERQKMLKELNLMRMGGKREKERILEWKRGKEEKN